MSEQTGSRYPGWRPFQDDPVDRMVFKGRSVEIETLLHTVMSERLVVVHAKSGVGKTSLLNAGIAKPLRDAGRFPLRIRVNAPDIGPVQSIYESIEKQLKGSPTEYLEGDRTSLWHFFKTAEFWQGDRLLTPILIVDQFEELFTLNSPAQREEFVRQLADLVRGRVPRDHIIEESGLTESPPVLGVVLSMRDDFLGQMEELADRIPEILQIRFQLKPLNRSQASEAILEPARIEHEQIGGERFGYSDEALRTILDLLCRQPHTGGAARAEPFQLQVICRKVEQIVASKRIADSSYGEVTLEDLGGEKGIRKTIADFYEQQLSAMDRSRRLRKMCEVGLINDDGRRLSTDGAALARQFKVTPESLEALVERKVLRRDPRLGGIYYELSHDTLVVPVLASRRRRRIRSLTLKFVVGVVIVGWISTALLLTMFENRAARNEAEAQVETSQATVLTALEILDAVRQLQPPPPEDLIQRIGATAVTAQNAQSLAEDLLESKTFSDAWSAGAEAESLALDACKGMEERIIVPRMKAFESDSSSRLADLAKIGADQQNAERWSAVEERLAVLQESASGTCEDAKRRLDLTNAATDIGTELSAMEQEAEAHWQELADLSAQAAEAALARLGEPSGANLELAAREAAKNAFARGQAFQAKEDFLTARAAFREASSSADEADEISRAFGAREGWHELVRRAMERGIVGFDEAGEIAESGSRAYERRLWDLAESDFENATTIGEREFDTFVERLSVASSFHIEATAAREVAELLAGQDPEDSRNLRRGNALLSGATLSFEARRFEDATEQFVETIEAFGQVGQESDNQALQNALTSLEEEQNSLGLVCDSGIPEVEVICERLSELRQVAENEDPPTRVALESYAQANSLEQRAVERVRAAARPPQIIARSPEEQDLRVFRRNPVTLAVEVESTPGERLVFAWSIPAGPLDSLGPSLTFSPEASTRVTLTVSGRGGNATETWDLAVTNRGPSLSVMPGNREVTISVGEQQRFEAVASDPDEEPVDVIYLLDGEEVGRGPSFEFVGDRRGTLQLTVRAEDESGAATEVQRTIRVRSGPIATQSAPEFDDAYFARRALNTYRKAYEARDQRKLAQVWNMTSLQRKELSRIFSEAKTIEISVVERDLREREDGTIEIDFDQQLRIVEGKLPMGRAFSAQSSGSFQSSSLTATMVQRGETEWVISTLIPRGGAQREPAKR